MNKNEQNKRKFGIWTLDKKLRAILSVRNSMKNYANTCFRAKTSNQNKSFVKSVFMFHIVRHKLLLFLLLLLLLLLVILKFLLSWFSNSYMRSELTSRGKIAF